ncbi:hypothetical protein [Nitrosomonas ureae]|uniref:hypothetical protein n=1 Tax=Nitrosomonas ureae TaxID=44577 RepID=UPI001160D9D7|nr:hypothetical protein [Nitrosomonas ureae]
MADLSKLRNLYWQIRYHRNKSIKRRYYRYVFKEKQRLIESGVDHEELRLICRVLANRINVHAEKRLEDYRKNRSENPPFS